MKVQDVARFANSRLSSDGWTTSISSPYLTSNIYLPHIILRPAEVFCFIPLSWTTILHRTFYTSSSSMAESPAYVDVKITTAERLAPV